MIYSDIMSKNSINSPFLHGGSIDGNGDGDSVFVNDGSSIDGDDDSIDVGSGVDDDSNASRLVIGALEVYTVE